MVEVGDFKIYAKGKVIDVDDFEKGAKLQFLVRKQKSGGLDIFNVKVEGTRRNDLEQFINKMVELQDIKITQIDFNKYYKLEDISQIKILGEKKWVTE